MAPTRRERIPHPRAHLTGGARRLNTSKIKRNWGGAGNARTLLKMGLWSFGQEITELRREEKIPPPPVLGFFGGLLLVNCYVGWGEFPFCAPNPRSPPRPRFFLDWERVERSGCVRESGLFKNWYRVGGNFFKGERRRLFWLIQKFSLRAFERAKSTGRKEINNVLGPPAGDPPLNTTVRKSSYLNGDLARGENCCVGREEKRERAWVGLPGVFWSWGALWVVICKFKFAYKFRCHNFFGKKNSN